jgi:hypothetical protein
MPTVDGPAASVCQDAERRGRSYSGSNVIASFPANERTGESAAMQGPLKFGALLCSQKGASKIQHWIA